MHALETHHPAERSLVRELVGAARYHLGSRRSLLILGGAAAVAGLVANWSWLVAVGIAPLLLAVAPCAAMCALGLCMSHRASGSGPAEKGAPLDAAATPASVADPNQLALALDRPDHPPAAAKP